MHLAKHAIRMHVIPKSKSVLGTTFSSRGMVSMHGGRLKKNTGPFITSKGTQPESDLTGKHQVVVVAVCPKQGCKDQNCATGTQLSTETSQPNPCGETAQYHAQPMAPHPVITYELAGNATSNIPANKKGIIIDSQVQMNNNAKPQELVTESFTVQVPAGSVNDNSQSTKYLQKDSRTAVIVNAMPSDSILK
jgi:hypothetical protein